MPVSLEATNAGICAGADGALAMWCFFAQLDSIRHAIGNARAAADARKTIWSDRSADSPHGQEQNRLRMVLGGPEQFIGEMVLAVLPPSGELQRVRCAFFS